MSAPQIHTFNKRAIKERLKKTDKEAYDLIIALEEVIQAERRITAQAIRKIKELDNE